MSSRAIEVARLERGRNLSETKAADKEKRLIMLRIQIFPEATGRTGQTPWRNANSVFLISPFPPGRSPDVLLRENSSPVVCPLR